MGECKREVQRRNEDFLHFTVFYFKDKVGILKFYGVQE